MDRKRVVITGLGVAPAVLITSSGFNNLLPDTANDYQSNAIVIQNHAYGTSIEGFSGSLANAFDVSANENLPLERPHAAYPFSDVGIDFLTCSRRTGKIYPSKFVENFFRNHDFLTW